MSEPVLDPIDSFVGSVAQSIGGISYEEELAVYGSASAFYAIAPDGTPAASTVPLVGDVLRWLRAGPCRWCGGGLAGHGIDLSSFGVEVRCTRLGRNLPAGQWMAGPPPVPVGRQLLALVMWVFLPVLCIGLLSWLMPTIAAVTRKRRAWGVAGALFGLLVVAGLLLPTAVGPLFLIVAWWGAPVWGAFQIKPWLNSYPDQRR